MVKPDTTFSLSIVVDRDILDKLEALESYLNVVRMNAFRLGPMSQRAVYEAVATVGELRESLTVELKGDTVDPVVIPADAVKWNESK